MNRFLHYIAFSRTSRNILPSVLHRNLCTTEFKPFYEHFFQYAENTAVVDKYGSYKYKDILYASYVLSKKIKALIPDSGKKSERISFLCSSDATYVAVFLACWITGNTAVPLCTSHPSTLLEYFIEDSQSKLVITNQKFSEPMKRLATKFNASFMEVDKDIFSLPSPRNHHELRASDIFAWSPDMSNKNALIIYTSGTTGRPKGVVLTHCNLHAQISAVVQSWEISSEDSILHSLPLHHIHGIMNGLLCLLNAGGTVVMQSKFDASEAWKYFLNSDNEKSKVNLFFAVPTMYVKLIQEFETVKESDARMKCLQNMRLMSSGSSALPVPVFHRWADITGHLLLERFGMSEIGMAMSNPLKGERVPGTVGKPLPDVEVKIRSTKGASPAKCIDLVYGNHTAIDITPGGEEHSGELLIRGPNVFKEYWNKEKATLEAFTEDGWFQTGDTATFESGAFKILGRTSVDMIKSGGFKISALEVESCLLRHPDIAECVVLGLPDTVWGEIVAALIVATDQENHISDAELKSWCKQQLPKYSVPTKITFVDFLPRNVMGKVNKKELKAAYSSTTNV